MLRLCWIDVYLSSFDHILTDADKNFASKEFRQFVISMTIITKVVSMKTHWSIDVVERYHVELRRAYQMIFDDLDVNKEIVLQMIVKAINDTVDFDDLMLILLIFEAYFRMHVMNLSASSIIQRAMIIEKVMIEIRKFRVERQIVDVLNTRNDSIITSIHDLSLNSDVLIWREEKKWIESFKLLDIEDETCKVVLSFESIDFRSTVIKSFLIELINNVESIDENVQSISEIEDVQSSDHQNNLSAESFEIIRSFAIIRFVRTRRLSLRYQNLADITVFLQNDEFSNQFEDSSSQTLILIFQNSRRKEINDLLEKRVFELITIDVVLRDVRIYNFRFVDEIKHVETIETYEKSRLVVQIYNDHDKTLMLIQSFIIQRMSQRIILVLTACIISDCYLYLRNITQTYVQSKISFNRAFFIRSLSELDLSKDSILRVVKLLYDVSETETHWFNTYQKHHKKKLSMIESTFDSCLLHIKLISQIEFIEFINQSSFISNFGIVDLQTDDTLILVDDEFATLEEKKLTRARLTFKKREKLISTISIKFNDDLISLSDNSLLLAQSKQFDQIKLINLTSSINLRSSREEIRKIITLKDQYVAQRARDAYIATISQLEAFFDLSFAAQTINSKKKDAKRLNQRLQWQLNNSTRELRFVFLNRNQLKLMIFIDAALTNTIDLQSQIDYVICLINDVHINLIHWSSIKCKRVIRSVLAAELYAMINDFDVEAIIKSIIEHILKLKNSLSLILLTDSKSLYDCLVKLDTIAEKRLMIDLMCLRQSYERREIAKIRWIDEDSNSADAMTKSKLCNALIKLIDSNIIELKITEWVERATEHFWRDRLMRIFMTIESLTRQIYESTFDDQNRWWSKLLMI